MLPTAMQQAGDLKLKRVPQNKLRDKAVHDKHPLGYKPVLRVPKYQNQL